MGGVSETGKQLQNTDRACVEWLKVSVRKVELEEKKS
jgi:hypothetical protein